MQKDTNVIKSDIEESDINVEVTDQHLLINNNDYTNLIRKYTSNYEVDAYHIRVGKAIVSQGWILHLTAIPSQINKLVEIAVPELLFFKVPFKIIKNKRLHIDINGGKYGQFKVGKVITVFLEDTSKIEPLIKKLLSTTAGLTGPQVFTDFWLSDILYVRYGSFIPIIEVDSLGNRVRLMRDINGKLILDKYFTPPYVPVGVNNPFLTIISTIPERPKLLLIGKKYMAVKLLKSDVKGNVWRGLYFKNYLLPKWCVIKQGRKGMFPDEYGRDVRDRLEWQSIANKDLKSIIPTPSILSYLEENGHTYIVMSYVKKGLDLNRSIFFKLKNTAWFAQPIKVKLQIFDCLLQILSGIGAMHEKKYIHRDITGTNFLITKRNKVKLIDLELTYSIQNNTPTPPFGVGTPGYVSPEQQSNQHPSISDDTYSIGALMVLIFSGGLEPAYLIDTNIRSLYDRLNFLINDPGIVSLIMSCLSASSDMRPKTGLIYSKIAEIRSSMEGQKEVYSPIHTSKTQFNQSATNETIINAINSFSGDLMTSKNLWFSRIENEYDWEIYPLVDKHIFSSAYRGISGVIYILSKLKQFGFNVDKTKEKLTAGVKFIEQELSERFDQMDPSLYYGKAGIAVSLSNALENGLIDYKDNYKDLILNCFQQTSSSLDIIYGVAGQGFAAMQCSRYLSKNNLSEILKKYADIILNAQQNDGSWVTGENKREAEIVSGFGYGIAGIIAFLLEYGTHYSCARSMESAEKGLKYLSRHMKEKESHYEWNISSTNKTVSAWWCKGTTGIALAFLKAYQYTKKTTYLEIVNKTLDIVPKYFVHSKLGQCHGLSGLGEIYLEAYKITNANEWLERATWISNLLLHLKKSLSSEEEYWLVEKCDFPTADFMTGNSGVIHFLLRTLFKERMGFPLIYK